MLPVSACGVPDQHATWHPASSSGHLPPQQLLYSFTYLYIMETTDLWILSYDVDGRDRATATRVCKLIFGRKNTTTREGRPADYEQAGFIHRQGVVWVGQSVLILP